MKWISVILNKYIKEVGVYLTAFCMCIVALAWVMKLWTADLDIPFSYSGDGLLTCMLVKGTIENGWFLYNNYLGMPQGQCLYDFPFTNYLDFIFLKIISLFIHDYATTLNFYYLLTFPLTTLTAIYVFRQFKIPIFFSIVGSLLYTFTPYHFLRGEHHLGLAAYYMVPPMIMVILWVFTDKSFLFHGNNGWNNLISKKFAISALICVLVSSAFIYYTFFSCFLLLIAGIIAYLSQRNKYPLLNSLILISVIIFGILVNMSPFLIYQIENGKNPEAVIRSPAESELYGLKIVQLLMPIGGHRIPLLANISGYYSGTAPLVNENAVASLGVIGSIGFLLLIAWAFYRISNGLMPKTVDLSSHINELSILNLSVVLLATLGGFGTLFAYLISSDIRGYNRVSIFIAFFSLFAVFLVLDAFSRKYAKSQTSRLLFNIFICIVLVFGILDQTSSSFVPPYASTKAEYLNDESFVDSIESIMPENAMIFQLPYIPFPEYPPVNRLTDYSHIRAYLHSKDLRWSYGAMKGRPGDAWQKLVAGMPVGDMLKTLSQSGFKGIYIDSYGYQDDGSKLISDIKQILGAEPLISNNQRIYFFDMTGFNKSVKADSSGTGPLFIAFNPGWHGQENWSGTQTRWMQADAGISATSFEDRAATLSMNALSFYCNRTLEISLGDEPATQVAVPTGFINVSMPIHLAKGVNTVRLRVSEGCEKPCDKPEMKTDDCRCLSLAINNITIM